MVSHDGYSDHLSMGEVISFFNRIALVHQSFPITNNHKKDTELMLKILDLFFKDDLFLHFN